MPSSPISPMLHISTSMPRKDLAWHSVDTHLLTFPRCLDARLRGKKASEPWRGASNFRCDMSLGGGWRVYWQKLSLLHPRTKVHLQIQMAESGRDARTSWRCMNASHNRCLTSYVHIRAVSVPCVMHANAPAPALDLHRSATGHKSAPSTYTSLYFGRRWIKQIILMRNCCCAVSSIRLDQQCPKP